jgi:hypothetical protein
VQYTKRMLQMRARAWALRDVFTDVLKGLSMAEEAMDTPPAMFMGSADVVGAPPPAEPPAYPEADFDKNLPSWRKAIESKKKTADDVIATVETKGRLTDAQKARIRGEQPATSKGEAQDVQPKVTYAVLADRLQKCEDRDAGAVVLDEGRGLPQDQRDDLARIFNEKFGE